MSSKRVKPQVEKFIIELRRFFDTHDYTVGEMLYALNIEVSKTKKTFLSLDDKEILECLEKANINERE